MFQTHVEVYCFVLVFNPRCISFHVSVGQSEAKVYKLNFACIFELSTMSIYTCHNFEHLVCHFCLLIWLCSISQHHFHSKAAIHHNPPTVFFPVQIEAIMNDFIQLEPQSNLFEAETMMEGAYFQQLLQGTD
jgi:hypothetical protein